MAQVNDVPLRFVNSLDTRKHIVLFYDDPDYAQKIEFQFIKNGLLRQESCIYASDEDPHDIIDKMITQGIDAEEFLKRRLLFVYQLGNPFECPEGPIKAAQNSIKEILSDIRSPFRVVGRIIPDVSTLEGISAEIKLEQTFHSTFNNFKGSVICPYHIEKMEATKRKLWFSKLFENHHSAIFAPKDGSGGVFELCESKVQMHACDEDRAI